jgi:ubiquinone/menaquinone biosynthesis C-methylase UbiE
MGERMEKLKQFLESIPDAKILDVGTGAGNFIHLITSLTNKYEKIVGIDILDRMVEMSGKHFAENEKIKIVKRDILETGFPENHFDIVCLSNSLHHLSDVEGTFHAMENLVKPGGYLLFNEMRSDGLNEKQISHKLIHHFAAKLDRELHMIHDETFKKDEIIELIKKHTSGIITEYWDMVVPKTASNPEEVESMMKTVDALLMRVKDETLIQKYRPEAEEIKEYLKTHGIEACTQLVVIVQLTK